MSREEDHIAKMLLPYKPELRDLVQALRKWIKAETGPAVELVYNSKAHTGTTYGFTEKALDAYCGISIHTNHVSLHFPFGAFINDMDGLLLGDGKRNRYLKLLTLHEVQCPAVMQMLKEARALGLDDVEQDPTGPCRIVLKHPHSV